MLAPRIFELVAYVDKPMPGGILDWPNNIQDIIYHKIERLEKRENITCTLVSSKCDKDYDLTEAMDKWYVQVIVQGTPRRVN